MPTDLLRYLAGPTGYSPWWWLIVAVLLLAVIAWYAGVFVWTLPPARLRTNRLLGRLHRRLLVRRFTRTVRATTEAYRAGTLSAPQAAAAYTRTLRSFLNVATGAPTHHMPVAELADSPLAPAAPLVSALNEIRFNGGPPHSHDEVVQIGAAVEEAMARWS